MSERKIQLSRDSDVQCAYIVGSEPLNLHHGIISTLELHKAGVRELPTCNKKDPAGGILPKKGLLTCLDHPGKVLQNAVSKITLQVVVQGKRDIKAANCLCLNQTNTS